MQIGEVAERTSLSIRTVRHYDSVGLVVPSARSVGGFRLYTDSDVERLLVIRRMKPLDFALAEMKELLDSLDILADESSSDEERTSAAQFVDHCHNKTLERCETLRRHLAYGEEFAGLLAARKPVTGL
ncbi:MerR family transcriptional regulator [Rhodococcus sp. Leaf7]|uniref:MerR family transcriptional regulator n=1 Tax=unclassified Rhodococcus (in: high G+C Gram-positive bacteria) TaxID=192944 RepID=UPI0006FA5FC4|nr:MULTISPECIES: MerR family transcriptional regulator [unclassified Rhodococcus (in: high G+C Gram-positive bacteria)]KQU07938.1 MerR family transcriptional regulator [Rhodococcus sp. Leaf7]KQU42998.1 MerR family transcriptional regulator [Rhodococcus sp. Leaf247]